MNKHTYVRKAATGRTAGFYYILMGHQHIGCTAVFAFAHTNLLMWILFYVLSC